MKNKVTVTISGQNYTMVATEDESYICKVAAHVDRQISDMLKNSKLSQVDASVLAAVNIADRLLQEQDTLENLRRQLKEEIESSARLKMDLSEARREIFKLENRK